MCINLIVINTAFMLEPQRNPSHRSVALVPSVSQILSVSLRFSTQKQVGTLELQDATALRSTSHCPNEASWHQ